MRPLRHMPRRALVLSAAGGLAVAALGLSGCSYVAAPGSGVDQGFGGCGDTTSVVRGCTAGVLAFGITIKDKSGTVHPPGSGRVLSRGTDGQSKQISTDFDFSGPPAWNIYFDWTGVDLSAPLMEQIVSKPTAGPFPDVWMLDVQLPTRASANLPAAPVASLFARNSPAPRGPAPAPPTVLDARQSTGSGLTYSWDTNGDGTFGDDPAGGWAGAPAPATGTAYLPQASLAAASVSPSVRVTDQAGQKANATIAVPIWDGGAGGLVVGSATGDQLALWVDIGTLPIGNDPTGHVHYACIDIGDDGTYDTELPRNFVGVFPYAPTGFYPYLAPGWDGVKRVRVAFYADDPAVGVSRGTCANPAPGAQVLSTHTALVNGGSKALAERVPHTNVKVRGYRGTARVRLAAGAVLSPGTQRGTQVTGVVNRGRYTLHTPARGSGVARPATLAAFSAGDFASTSNASIGFTDAGKASIVGTTTMVIRGSGTALACVKVAQTDSSTIWTVMGGTGAARTLRMVLNGGPTLNSLITTAAPVNAKVTGTGKEASMALSPVSTSYKVNASSGAGRGMSSACRALVTRLP